jgi:GT2 family glycosyltransferase
MVSIILSTAQGKTEILEKNIKDTIGIEYEIVKIQNKGKYSLSKAYNIGTQQAQYEYLCFIHDDILFRTKDWGKKMVDSFQNALLSPALIGVIGTEYKSVFPGPWTCPLNQYNKGNVEQYFKYKVCEPNRISYSSGNQLQEVVVVDGMFLFTTRTILKEIHFFDEKLLGFHCYDIDLALSLYHLGKKIYVDESILLEHHSEGKLNNDWFENQLYLVRKWKTTLPANVLERGKVNYEIEVGSLKRILYLLSAHQVRFSTKCKFIYFFLTFHKLPIFRYLSLYVKVFQNYLK